MALNPLNELKRRLDDDSTPLSKRLCLAKNVVFSPYFPTAPKETVVANWLEKLATKKDLDGKVFKKVLNWIGVNELTSELKSRLIKITSKYLENSQLKNDDIPHIIKLLDNEKVINQLTQQIDDYLFITITLLKHLKDEENKNVDLTERIFNNFVKYYKECKKKLEFIIKVLNGANIETIFNYLDTDCHDSVINVCQNVLFPMNKKSFFVSFLQTLIRKDNINDLMAEKGDNIQSVLKIMSCFFTFPQARTKKDPKFLSDFIDVFVSCFKNESQIIFAFYIMVVNSLNMDQSYLSPAMKMPPIMFEENDEKIKRNLFLKMLEILLKNEVDITVRLTDTFGEKISKVEIKKNFMSFLQIVMMGQLKLEGKLDKTTLQIVKTALMLDPILIEQRMDKILPPIMTAKKNSSSVNETYVDMMNCLLEILFKLSRGTIFINQILPHLKVCLEAGNTEQFELKQTIKECENSGANCEKLKSKVISGNDILPSESVEMYGKWTSELMFRQNKELLVSLQKDLEEHCLLMLEEGFVSPSIITLAEVLSAILSSFLRYNKMADHTVPKQIAEDFWTAFQNFKEECLRKFGECVLKLNYNPQLAISFLQLCLSVANLKLLNIKYSHTKIDIQVPRTSEVFDLSFLLPCLNSKQWIKLAEKINEDEAVLVLDSLLLAKTTALQLVSQSDEGQNEIELTKTHLIKQIGLTTEVLDIRGFSNVLFADLDEKQLKNIAKNLFKMFLNNPQTELLQNDSVQSNRPLLNAIVVEAARNMAKCFENTNDLPKVLAKSDFDLASFMNKNDTKQYFEQITLEEGQENILSNCIEVLRQLPLPYLEESYQLVVIFLLLVAKKCCHKKIRKSVDHILLHMFELTPKYPDVFKLFPVELIFNFDDTFFLNLLTLKIKTSNNLLIVKCILESAVKKVKTNSELVKTIVQILLSKQKIKKDEFSSIEHFSDSIFQISCIILPIISKERKAITTSAYRSILATLQEKLHKSLLKSFKNIDFSNNISLFNDTSGNVDESMVVSESTLATLNAMAAYSLTLAKFCETTDNDELKNMECLWSALDFFIQNAIKAIGNPVSKSHHVESSTQLLNVVLRYIKKLETHTLFEKKDEVFKQIWKSIIDRLNITFGEEKKFNLDEFGVTLKFLCELASVECFVSVFVLDLMNLGVLKDSQKPSDLLNDTSIITSHKVSKHLWLQILKANLLGQKCVALSRLLSKMCKDLRNWIKIYFEDVDLKRRKSEEEEEIRIVKISDEVCEVLKLDLDIVSEAVLAAKKINLDYKLLDSIFCVQHQIHYLMGYTSLKARCETTYKSFFKLFEGSFSVLNNLLMSREELLEDRWPNFMQCYRALVSRICELSSSREVLERRVEEKLAENAHSLERLTQSVCKRKAHVSRIAAYSAADVCSLLERSVPSKLVRTHVENCAALLLQAADSSYAQPFLRRALASSPGHVTLANMYTLYKRYHKYTGKA